MNDLVCCVMVTHRTKGVMRLRFNPVYSYSRELMEGT